jgi:hypothetical protein
MFKEFADLNGGVLIILELFIFSNYYFDNILLLFMSTHNLSIFYYNIVNNVPIYVFNFIEESFN